MYTIFTIQDKTRSFLYKRNTSKHQLHIEHDFIEGISNNFTKSTELIRYKNATISQTNITFLDISLCIFAISAIF